MTLRIPDKFAKSLPNGLVEVAGEGTVEIANRNQFDNISKILMSAADVSQSARDLDLD